MHSAPARLQAPHLGSPSSHRAFFWRHDSHAYTVQYPFKMQEDESYLNCNRLPHLRLLRLHIGNLVNASLRHCSILAHVEDEAWMYLPWKEETVQLESASRDFRFSITMLTDPSSMLNSSRKADSSTMPCVHCHETPLRRSGTESNEQTVIKLI